MNIGKKEDLIKEEDLGKTTRSEFLRKAGKLALVTAPAFLVLFTSTRAKADSNSQDQGGSGCPLP